MTVVTLHVLLATLALTLASISLLVVITALWIERRRRNDIRARQKRAWKKIEKEWRATIK